MTGDLRYHVSAKSAGINNGILENKLGIKDQEKLDQAESLLLADTYMHFLQLVKDGEVIFDLSLLFAIHKYFFETLYEWAGQVRSVDISKSGMLFAPVKFIDKSLEEFKLILKNNLPKQTDTKNDISKKLALIHNEFNVIHPFREGNGRTIRLFLDLILTHLGYEYIDWSKSLKVDYLKACISGTAGTHTAMAKIIKQGIKKST